MEVPQTPTWPWIVGGIITALIILAGVVKLLYSSKEKTQTSLVDVLQKDIDRRDRADERRGEEMKSIMATHEKTAERTASATAVLGQTIKTAIDDTSKETQSLVRELVRELRSERGRRDGQ